MELTSTSPVRLGKTSPSLVDTFSRETVFQTCLEYFNGDQLAANVWINKYALMDANDNIYERSPEDMHKRLASEIARIEKKYPNPLSEKKIFHLLKDFKYIIPQGGPMAGIGNPRQVTSLSNCFVIGNQFDSYAGILRTDEEQAHLMKRRGGVGHDLSHIRPKGQPVKNSAMTSTGLGPFMERFSNCTREVAQGGRRGALMLTVSSRHPDAEDFVDIKTENGKVTGANVSVKIDDAFMKAALANKPYTQQYPVNSRSPIVKKKIQAKALWDKITYNAWKSAEPGVLFWDTVIRESVPDCYADLGYATVSTNPCGEIPLCPYDSCRLLAINLYSFVDNPFTSKARFNLDLFEEYAGYAQRIMDDIIDLELEKIDAILEKINHDPEPDSIKSTERDMWYKIRETCKEGRRTGVGITAEGDMLAALGLRYGSPDATDFATNIHKTLAIFAYKSSVQMAKERGAFSIYDAKREENNPFIQRLFKASPELRDAMKKHGRRNIALLTIAPTGTTSLMSQTSSGIEPVFMISYKRRRKINPNDKSAHTHFIDDQGDCWEEYRVFHHKFKDWLQSNNYNIEQVEKMDDKALKEIIALSPYYLATANDIDWVEKVKMQGAIQKWIDHSISVTVNIPENTSVDMVREIYITAWEHGCKGCTIYRDGSRSGVLVADNKKENKSVNKAIQDYIPPKRPKKLEASVVRFKNNREDWIAVVGILNNRPYEIFTGNAEDTFRLPNYVTQGWILKSFDEEKNNNRYDFQFLDKDKYKVTIDGLSRSFNEEYWNYAKLISGILRHGMPLEYVVNLITRLNLDEKLINTWKSGVVRALKKFIPNGTSVVKKACPGCKDPDGLVYKEGCLMCKSCGYSECS